MDQIKMPLLQTVAKRGLGLEMTRRLLVSTICLVAFLLVLPPAYSDDDENKGMNDIGERLLKLLQAEKERRQMSDDTNTDGSGGTGQGNADDSADGDKVTIEKEGSGIIKTDIEDKGEESEQIIADCKNRYELIKIKGDDDGKGGVCYFHKMDNERYEAYCNENGNKEEVVDIKYDIGQQVEDKTLLSNIKGGASCLDRPTYELIPVSVKREKPDEYEKRLAQRRDCNCQQYSECTPYCIRKEGWWWGERCVHHGLDCVYKCKYECR